ncbi:MAG: hypothetical protein ACRCVT_01810 [Leadbetterella sp.]
MKNIRSLFILFFCILSIANLYGQYKPYFDFGVASGSQSNTELLSYSAMLGKNFKIGKMKRFTIGTGIRYTGFDAKNPIYTSAPSSFAADPLTVDTVMTNSSSMHSLNAIINLGFRLTKRIGLGFDIDAIGVSFGEKKNVDYVNEGKKSSVEASPFSPNILLVGNNDRGSLNSRFYVNYGITKRFGIKLAYQFLFNEYKTSSEVQTETIDSKSTTNDRFRAKSSMIYLGGYVKF